MLKIFYNLGAFFEDCYREIGVREYSRIMNVSPPTASKILKEFELEKFVKKRFDKGYILFRVNRENLIMRDFSRIYWRQKLKKVIEKINDEYFNPKIILFGSLIKLENKKDSDIDIAIFTELNKKIDLIKYEKELGREIQLFFFKSLSEIPKELKKNISKGYVLQGENNGLD